MRTLLFAIVLSLTLGAFAWVNLAYRNAGGAVAGGASPRATVDLNCDRASHLAKQAWSDAGDPSARYDAATEALGLINACDDPDQRAFGSAMLMAAKTDAEYRLHLGNAPYDVQRAIELLRACEERFRETKQLESGDCERNRKLLESYPR